MVLDAPPALWAAALEARRTEGEKALHLLRLHAAAFLNAHRGENSPAVEATDLLWLSSDRVKPAESADPAPPDWSQARSILERLNRNSNPA